MPGRPASPLLPRGQSADDASAHLLGRCAREGVLPCRRGGIGHCFASPRLRLLRGGRYFNQIIVDSTPLLYGVRRNDDTSLDNLAAFDVLANLMIESRTNRFGQHCSCATIYQINTGAPATSAVACRPPRSAPSRETSSSAAAPPKRSALQERYVGQDVILRRGWQPASFRRRPSATRPQDAILPHTGAPLPCVHLRSDTSRFADESRRPPLSSRAPHFAAESNFHGRIKSCASFSSAAKEASEKPVLPPPQDYNFRGSGTAPWS